MSDHSGAKIENVTFGRSSAGGVKVHRIKVSEGCW